MQTRIRRRSILGAVVVSVVLVAQSIQGVSRAGQAAEQGQSDAEKRIQDQAPAQSQTGATEYTYTLKDGETVKLDFPIFVEGQATKVTKDVFRGYLMYNSYCYRCHGQDATESHLAPDLRASLSKGMTAEQYLSVAMAGKDDKGMPSWAGFLTEEEVRQTYMYVQGRRLGLVPVGRPPSEY